MNIDLMLKILRDGDPVDFLQKLSEAGKRLSVIGENVKEFSGISAEIVKKLQKIDDIAKEGKK